MKTALIISLNFRAAHVSHLVASYYQMKELGFHPLLWVNKECVKFLPPQIDYILSITEVKEVNIAIFWFPAIRNIKAMWSLKHKFHAKIIYVFHEPVESFSAYKNSGNSLLWTATFFLKYYISLSFLLLSDKIILPSKKALTLYKKGISYRINNHIDQFPILYCDEKNKNIDVRKFFSYIGTISKDHAFDEYVNFIYYLSKNNLIDNVQFLIATWSNIPEDKRIAEMVNNGRLKVVSGKPMSNEEINDYYGSSILVWNAYHRTTQSGVLAKSFMFGAPGLILKINLSEFVEDGREVIAIHSNRDFNELMDALKTVINEFDLFSKHARENFERNYLYSVHNEKMKQILSSL